MENVISVRNISKAYKLGTISRHTLQDEMTYLWHKMLGRDPKAFMGKVGAFPVNNQVENGRFLALNDISFDIAKGEVLGIIGKNGAGKSTILKILSRITAPTSGTAIIDGTVGSLLEVGTGFHPELTGRENVYMNGTILGMKKSEIDHKFSKIVEFAELSQFIDTPVKRYSSGMYVRLAFSVAAHLEPEILLVDEVLAVGDIGFQQKCLGRMSEVAGHGRTVLFVSHNMGAINRLCTSAILLHKGRLIMRDSPAKIIEKYYELNTKDAGLERSVEGIAGFTKWWANSDKESESKFTISKEPCSLSFMIHSKEQINQVYFGIGIYSNDGTMIWAMKTRDASNGTVDLSPGKHIIKFILDSLPVKPGAYYLRITMDSMNQSIDVWDVSSSLTVLGTDSRVSEKWQGMFNLDAAFSMTE